MRDETTCSLNIHPPANVTQLANSTQFFDEAKYSALAEMHPFRILLLLPFMATVGSKPGRGDDNPLDFTRTVEVEVTTTILTTTLVGAAYLGSLRQKGVISTHYKFLSGSPPNTSTRVPLWVSTTRRPAVFEFSTTRYSEPGTVVSSETTIVTETLMAYATRPATTQTIYPCANMSNFHGPAYGDAKISAPLDQQKSYYELKNSTGYGASAESCCNACYFAVSNCVQAYWYFYGGCVISVATNLTASSGVNPSSVCPVGTFEGLTYGPDLNPAFLSTGNIAGPCGWDYTNF
ncbi:hypothetical protein K449DRAFT_426864 [Hypoxylon sp. EC38]|nr:hypothetical protein K449DRAFT_426864 [Hypoxylon sp. EC38]